MGNNLKILYFHPRKERNQDISSLIFIIMLLIWKHIAVALIYMEELLVFLMGFLSNKGMSLKKCLHWMIFIFCLRASFPSLLKTYFFFKRIIFLFFLFTVLFLSTVIPFLMKTFILLNHLYRFKMSLDHLKYQFQILFLQILLLFF